MTLLKQVVSVDVTQTALKGPAAAQGRSAAAEDTTVRIIYEAEVARDLRWTPSNNGGGLAFNNAAGEVQCILRADEEGGNYTGLFMVFNLTAGIIISPEPGTLDTPVNSGYIWSWF